MNNIPKNVRRSEQANDGVFEHFINNAGFLDKVEVAVWGRRRKRPSPLILGAKNFAIGGPLSFYARCMRRRHGASGNRAQVKYGRMRQFKNLRPFVVTMWSGESPLTCADVALFLDGFFRRGHKAVVSRVELTFDTSGIPLWRFGRDLCCRARVTEHWGKNGKVTLYVGGANSPLQLRIYEKSDSIVRVEFILRSQMLRKLHVYKLQDLLLLKRADIWKHVGFHEVVHTEGHLLPARVREPWIKNGLRLPPAMPASIVERELRAARINPDRWVVRSDRELLLRKMQRRLIW